jgi:hypothetical protein
MCKEQCVADPRAPKLPIENPGSIFYGCGVSPTSHYKER